jgi:hypothetical protein
MNGEKGQALPIAMIALAFGTLVISPFLTHASSNLIGSRAYGEQMAEIYSCDAGIEHAIWSLTNGGLAEQFTSPGDEIIYGLGEAINGFSPVIAITANVTASGGTIGDIADAVIDTLEFDTSNSYEPEIIRVSGNVSAVAYRGPGNNGFLKTVTIATNGDIGNSVIDTLEFDTADGWEPDIIQVSGNIYAIAYRGVNDDGFLKTVTIAANGDIGNAVIDTLEFDTADGFEPVLIYVSGNVYAVAYRGVNSDGFLKTVTIAANGDIGNAVIDTLEFDTADGFEPDMINVSGNIYAIAYRGSGGNGFLKTLTMATNGDIGNSVIDTLQFDASNGYTPFIINVSGNVYGMAYRGSNFDGFLKTVSIAPDGSIADAVIDTLEFDTADGYEPYIIQVSDGVYAIAYRGVSNDGFIKTVRITTMADISASYRIVSAAGGSTIRAFLDIVSSNVTDTVTILSWQVE